MLHTEEIRRHHSSRQHHPHHRVNMQAPATQTISPLRSSRGRRIQSSSRDHYEQRYQGSQLLQPRQRSDGGYITQPANNPSGTNQVRIFPTATPPSGNWTVEVGQPISAVQQWRPGEGTRPAKKHGEGVRTTTVVLKETQRLGAGKGVAGSRRETGQRQRRKQVASYQGNPEQLERRSSLDNLLGLGQIDLGPGFPVGAPLEMRLSEESWLGIGRPSGDGLHHHHHHHYHHGQKPPRLSAISPYGVFQQSCLRSLASMLLCPQTVLPIVVGLFHRPRAHPEGGYLRYLSDEILQLTSQNPQLLPQQTIGYGCKSTLLHTFMLFLLGYVLGLGFGWELGGTVAATAVFFYFLAVGIIYIGVKVRHWRSAIHLAETLSRYFRRGNLLVNILFCGPPSAPKLDKPVKLLPVSLDLADYRDGLEASASLAEKLWSAAEEKYGRLAVRLQWASGDSCEVRNGRTYRKCCCLPIWLWSTTGILSLLCLATVVSTRHRLLVTPLLPVKRNLTAVGGGGAAVSVEAWNTSESASRGVAIASAVLAIFSCLVVVSSTLRGLVNLIRGRPFLRKTLCFSRPATWDKLRPTQGENSCYGKDAGPFDPTVCFRPGVACYDIYGGHFGTVLTRPKQTSLLQCGLTPTVAAAANPITDGRQQRRRDQNPEQDTRQKRRNISGKHGYLNDSSDERHCSDSYSSDQSSRSEDMDEEEDDDDDDENDGKSAVASSENGGAKVTVDRSLFEDATTHTSGEWLIPDKPKMAKRKAKVKQAQSRAADSGNPYKQVDHSHCIRKTTKVIGNALVEIGRVLSIIDGRIEGRQTRMVVCISDSSCVDEMTVMRSLAKLVVLLRLLNHTVMRPSGGGKSNDATVLLKPSSQAPNATRPGDEKLPRVVKRDREDTWMSNMMVLVSAMVPTMQQRRMTWTRGSTVSLQAVDQRREYNLYESLSCKSWWTVHHFCHLPIYLDDEPPGSRILIPGGSEGKPHVANFSQSNESESSLLDRFLVHHELRDLNSRRCRQLLTMMSFMGRMIKITRMLANQYRLFMLTRHLKQSVAGPREPIPTERLINWLCLLVHWPFHAAWLSLFLETNCATADCQTPGALHHSGDGRTGGQVPPGEAGRGSQNGKRVWTEVAESEGTCGVVGLDTSLSQLHDRVLRRLASAIESTRMKSISASMGALHSGDSSRWQSTGLAQCLPPVGAQPSAQMISTLEVCELALQDRDPRRLATFLSPPSASRTTTGGKAPTPAVSGRPNNAGSMTVAQLVEVMQLTPFLNPYVTGWIKDMLSSRLKLSESHGEEKSQMGGWRSARPRDSSKNVVGEKINKCSDQVHANAHSGAVPTETCFCPVKLKHGLPTKPLAEMTVDEVCQLLANIADLSTNQISRKGSRRRNHQAAGDHSQARRKCRTFSGTCSGDRNSVIKSKTNKPAGSSEGSDAPLNDQNPPALSNERVDTLEQYHKALLRSYENRLRSLSVNGPVLSVCNIAELGRELNMSFGDWQLFSALISHLRSIETVARRQKDTVNPGIANPSTPSVNLPQNRGDVGLQNTVSDTSLALTVKSAPISEHSLPVSRKSHLGYVNSSKSMGNLLTGHNADQYGSAELPFAANTGVVGRRDQASVQTLPLYCNYHRQLKSREKACIVPTFCPKHQGQNRRLAPTNAFPPQTSPPDEAGLFKSHSDQHNFRHPTALPVQNVQPTGEGHPNIGHPQLFMPQGYYAYQPTATLPRANNVQAMVYQGQTIPPGQYLGANAYCTMHQVQAKDANSLEPSRGPDVHWQRKPVNLSKGTADQALQYAYMGDLAKIPFTRPANTNMSFDVRGIQSTELQDLPLVRDSASTSFAGELVEEVAQLSPMQLDQKMSPEVNSSATENQCDCNYWFALEAGASAQIPTGNLHQGLQGSRDTSQVYPDVERGDMVSELSNESLTESVGTTGSQFDISSGTMSDVEFSAGHEPNVKSL